MCPCASPARAAGRHAPVRIAQTGSWGSFGAGRLILRTRDDHEREGPREKDDLITMMRSSLVARTNTPIVETITTTAYYYYGAPDRTHTLIMSIT